MKLTILAFAISLLSAGSAFASGAGNPERLSQGEGSTLISARDDSHHVCDFSYKLETVQNRLQGNFALLHDGTTHDISAGVEIQNGLYVIDSPQMNRGPDYYSTVFGAPMGPFRMIGVKWADGASEFEVTEQDVGFFGEGRLRQFTCHREVVNPTVPQ